MLYLSRKLGESIIIDGNIEVVVTAINNKQVKLGIDAPRNSSVYRKELLEKIKSGNREAIESANWLIEDSDGVARTFSSDASILNGVIRDGLEIIYNLGMPNVLDITSKMSEFLKKYTISDCVKTRDTKMILEALCGNYKKLLAEVEKRNKVIEAEIAAVSDYLYRIGEAA